METDGEGTENKLDHSLRFNRRIKYNNEGNVNNTNLVVRNEAEISIRDENASNSYNSAIYSKTQATTTNINSSTPRRKKGPLSRLHSNLSPKYIGFTTPSNKLNESAEERTRSLRRRHNTGNTDTSVNIDKETESSFETTFTPNNDLTVGYVRRTPKSEDSYVTPDKSVRRKEFVSPIDKLLIKNGAVMEHILHLESDDLNKQDVLKNSKQHRESTELSIEKRKLNADMNENEIYEKSNNNEENILSSNKSIKDENVVGNELNKEKNDDLEKKSLNAVVVQSTKDDDNVDKLVVEDKGHIEKTSERYIETFKNDNKSFEITVQEQGNQKVKLGHSRADYSDEYLENTETDDLGTVQSEQDAKTLKSISPTNESLEKFSNTIVQNQKTQIQVELESIESESNNEFVDASATANSPSAISMDSAKGSSIINEGSWMTFSTGDLYWGQIYSYCYWPCMVCPDPGGKTITTEENGRSGDQHILVHVRFFADNGRRNWVKRENLMPYIGIENYQERIDEAREKYGSKSAKFKLYVPTKKKERVWYDAVNEANMVAEVPYADRLEKFFEIFEKSKAFHKLEKQRRKSMYLSVNCEPASDIESFYGSNDNINTLSVPAVKQKRERSISPYSPAYSPIKPAAPKRRKMSGEQEVTSSISTVATQSSSLVKSEQNPNGNELNLSQTSSVASTASLNGLEIFNSLEFKKFYTVMKDFVMEQNHNEKLEKSLVVAVRNIWALKQLSRQQMERSLQESLMETDMGSTHAVLNTRPNGEVSVKRLSSRLRTLMIRKSLVGQQTQESTPERSITPVPTKEILTVEKAKKPINRPILEVIDDIFELDNKYLFKGMNREPVCKYCYKPSGNLKKCAKNCGYWLHNECLYKDFTLNGKTRRSAKQLNSKKCNNETSDGSNNISITKLSETNSSTHVTGDLEIEYGEVICKECANNEPSTCMVCQRTESKRDNDPLVKCSMTQCERAFHPACCKYWPQSKITISKNHIEAFRCPSHVCHTCVSDDPKGKFQHLSNSKLTKCVKCPASFHTDSTCIPAGSQILTAAHIICPRHTSTKHDMNVNVNWCFICVGGGQLMCCETCPTAVHAQCLKIPIAANEGYICEECESGRMPLYGEMVWAKFNTFRWWPAIILPPTEIPQNIARKPHNPSDFVVRFFGTHDHGWISRRRVYLYLEGDSSEPPKTKSYLDVSYNRGIEEAKQVYEIIKTKKLQQSTNNEDKEKLHPQPYVRIKANRPVPPVKLHINIESVSKCECDPNDVNPCGPETNCLNRVLYHECNPKLCPAGERCQNQMFESRLSPRLDVVYMKERGFGLVCREPVKAGTFIIEYVGEIINDDEFKARLQQKSRDRDENFYFLSVEKDYIIDAGPKGNLARFMNHSCDPNCETQKWSVNSLNRVGLFAIKDIPENTELTFNYHWDDLLGNEKKTCYCGATKCAGQIGAKLKDLDIKEPSTSGIGKNKLKTKSKPFKKLIKVRKNIAEAKQKSNVKIKTKKKAMANTIAAFLKRNDNLTTSTTNEEVVDDDEASTSTRLQSPDLFC